MIKIPLRGRKGIIGYSLVDNEDAFRVNKHRWYLGFYGYAVNWTTAYDSLHRFILNLRRASKKEVDHIDGNRLNNQKNNLRLATSAQNKQNTNGKKHRISKYRGVSPTKNGKRWQAKAKLNNFTYYLGTFDSENAAHLVVSKWRRVNHPFSEADKTKGD